MAHAQTTTVAAFLNECSAYLRHTMRIDTHKSPYGDLSGASSWSSVRRFPGVIPSPLPSRPYNTQQLGPHTRHARRRL